MNSRFAVATHILTLLEQSRGEPVTSEYIAGSVNTNPSLVRRLLGVLAKAGLTTSQMGTGGGALLARPASRITLGAVLERRRDAAERVLEAELDRTTIAELGRDLAGAEPAGAREAC
jgi:DNA-binding IscR family transcriptional regulator